MQDLFNSTMPIEIIGEVPLFFGIGLQVLTALILGGIVGYDREVKMKAAGLKTNIMICIGATLYTTISLVSLTEHGGPADPNRVTAQIVSGIGFLGAGAIMQSKASITGLTTAATMWVVAAIGYTIGTGHILVAILFSMTALVVLKMISPLQKFMERSSGYKYFHLEVLAIEECSLTIENMISAESADIIQQKRTSDHKKDFIINDIILYCHPKAVERVSSELIDSVKIKKINYFEIVNPDEYLLKNETPLNIVNG